MTPKIHIICKDSGGDITRNPYINKFLKNEKLVYYAKKGTPVVKLGSGSPKVMVTAGVHGDELPPQLAAVRLIEFLKNCKLDGTVYVIPFVAPKSTMENVRNLRGKDLNRLSHCEGTITNHVLNFALSHADALADFHSTEIGGNPGEESVFCSKNPCMDSFILGSFIAQKISAKLICHEKAGEKYRGALEDECNLRYLPAVTCEVVSKKGKADEKV